MVGINSAGIEASGIDIGVNYAIVADELIKILDSERIEYTMAGGGVSWAQPWFAYVFLPIGVLALAGGIILLVTSPEERSGRPSSCRRCRRYGIWKSACKRRPRPCGKTGCAARRDRKILWPEL